MKNQRIAVIGIGATGVAVAASLKKHVAGVRPVNRGVTHCAGLIFDRLVMWWTRWTDHWKGVTLQAQQIHLTHAEQARVGGTMRRVTGTATFGLYRNVLEHEGPLLVGMALVTNRIATGESPHLAQRCGPVHVMAVVTLNQSFIDAMMIRFRKIRSLCHMTAIAEWRFGSHEQMLFFLGVMR